MNKIVKKIEDFIDTTVEGGASILGECLTDALVGQVAPGIVTMAMAYKQKRTEKMVMLALEELKTRANRLEQKLNLISVEQIEAIKEQVLPLIFDYVVDEIQEEKISFIINGFESIIEDFPFVEDLSFMYYDVLKQIRVHELHFFVKYYKPKKNLNGRNVLQDFKELEEMYSNFHWIYIAKRLEYLGLIRITASVASLNGQESPINPDHVKISIFGKEFMKFFKNRV